MNRATRLLTGSAGLALAVSGLLAPAPADAATPACTNGDLSASYHRHDAGMGHTYGWIALKNVSGHACHTGGYGGISYVGDGNGTQIGAPAVRVPGTPATFVLGPGQRLRSPIDQVTARNYPRKTCHPQHVDGFRVYVPNSTVSQFVKHPTTGCRNHHVKLIHQKAYRRP
jgi:Protein of unknown function (DUF4232)